MNPEGVDQVWSQIGLIGPNFEAKKYIVKSINNIPLGLNVYLEGKEDKGFI